MQKKLLTKKEKIAYGIGDMCVGGLFNIVNVFYAIYLTDFFGLSALIAPLVIMIARVYDGFTDPIMGYLSDKTKHKWGRRRIYLLAGVPLVFVSFILLFSPFVISIAGNKVLETALRFATALLFYLIFCTVQTIISVPYYAFSGEISSDYKERSSVLSIRLMFSLISTVLCFVLPDLIISSASSAAMGYFTMSATFGLFFSAALFCCAIFTREDTTIKPIVSKFSLKTILFEPVKIKAFRQYISLQIVKCTAMALMSMMVPYLIKYYLPTFSLSMVLGILVVSQLLSLVLWNIFIKRIGKSNVFIVGSILWIIGGLLVFTFTPAQPALLLYFYIFVLGFGMAGVVLSPNAMFGDVCDVGELATGQRCEGVFGGFESITYKSATAIATAVALFCMGLCGYISRDSSSLETFQPASAVLAIRLIICFSGIVFLIPGIWICLKYKLSEKVHARVAIVLSEKDDEKIDSAERAELIEMLVK